MQWLQGYTAAGLYQWPKLASHKVELVTHNICLCCLACQVGDAVIRFCPQCNHFHTLYTCMKHAVDLELPSKALSVTCQWRSCRHRHHDAQQTGNLVLQELHHIWYCILLITACMCITSNWSYLALCMDPQVVRTLIRGVGVCY